MAILGLELAILRLCMLGAPLSKLLYHTIEIVDNVILEKQLRVKNYPLNKVQLIEHSTYEGEGRKFKSG